MWETKKIVTLLAILFMATLNSNAKNTSLLPFSSKMEKLAESNCSLPAPTDIYTNLSEAHSIAIGWVHVTGAAKYYAIVKSETGVTVFDGIVPSNQLLLTNLQTATQYNYQLYSVCSNDELSTYESIYSEKTRGFIIEDYIANFQGTEESFECTELNIDEISENPVYFIAKYQESSSRPFGVYLSKVHNAISLFYEVGKSWKFKGENGQEPLYPEYVVTDYVRVFHSTTPQGFNSQAMEIHITPGEGNTVNMCISILNPDYSVKRELKNGKSHKRGQNITALTPIVSPNPCKDNFTLWLPESPQSASTIRLFNINGDEVYSETIEPFTQSKNIDIQQLLPGMYIAQLESADGIQTFKLIKGQ